MKQLIRHFWFQGIVGLLAGVGLLAARPLPLAEGPVPKDQPPGKELQCLKAEAVVTAVAILPDGRRVLTGSARTVILWDRASGKEERRWVEKDGISTVAFSPDGRTVLADGARHELVLWDAETGKELRRLKGHTREARAVF